MKTKTRRNRKNKKLYKGGEEKRVVIDLLNPLAFKYA